jgi:hypothetical protein
MIDWKNWKTGALIGLVYGIIGSGFFLILDWIDSPVIQPGSNAILDNGGGDILLTIIGALTFLPFVFLVAITPVNSTTISFALMPIYGAILGAAVGYFFGWFEKRQK